MLLHLLLLFLNLLTQLIDSLTELLEDVRPLHNLFFAALALERLNVNGRVAKKRMAKHGNCRWITALLDALKRLLQCRGVNGQMFGIRLLWCPEHWRTFSQRIIFNGGIPPLFSRQLGHLRRLDVTLDLLLSGISRHNISEKRLFAVLWEFRKESRETANVGLAQESRTVPHVAV